MYRSTRSILLLALPLLAMPALGTPVRHSLSEVEIRQALAGKVVGDGQHWTYHLKSNGSIEGAEMRRPVQGKWAIHDRRLCLSVPSGAPENCSEVVREGKGLLLHANGLDISDLYVEPYRSKRQWE